MPHSPGLGGELILDVWTPLSHKAPVAVGTGTTFAPGWTGHHARRINAYITALEYQFNVAREMMTDTDPARRAQHREYGDPALVVDRIRSAVLGEGFTLTVEHATDEPPDPEDADDEERQLIAEIDAANDRQTELNEWVEQTQALSWIGLAETHAVGLGDGVLVLTKSTADDRINLEAWEPGFYFPGDDDPSGSRGRRYPTRVHLAYEWEPNDSSGRFVRRKTWELVPISSVFFGEEQRRYPYQDADDEPSETVCLYTEADWEISTIGDRYVDDFPIGATKFVTMDDGQEANRLDLNLDFIPVVHIANTFGGDIYGEGSLSRVAQIFDDLAATDTDTASAGALTASPVLVMPGAPGSDGTTITTYGPGKVLWTGTTTGTGSATVVDLSAGVDALLRLTNALLDRLSVNRQLPQSVLGRNTGDAQESGFHLLLSFGPYRSLIENMRSAREDKYRLLLKFWQRMAIEAGHIEAPVMRAGMTFGPYLPADLDAETDRALRLHEARVISRATATRMVAEAGAAIDDPTAEAEAAQHEDFEGANALADAIADESEAREFLGREAEEPGPALLPPTL